MQFSPLSDLCTSILNESHMKRPSAAFFCSDLRVQCSSHVSSSRLEHVTPEPSIRSQAGTHKLGVATAAEVKVTS